MLRTMDSESRQPRLHTLIMLLAIAAAIVFALSLVRAAHRSPSRIVAESQSASFAPGPSDGVLATLKSGSATETRTYPTLDLTVEPGQSVDAELPPGRFEGEFEVRFRTGSIRRAGIGALLRGGSVIIMRGDEVLASDYADAQKTEKLVMTKTPVGALKKQELIRYLFKADGVGPHVLRAVWQPEDAPAPVALPAAWR